MEYVWELSGWKILSDPGEGGFCCLDGETGKYRSGEMRQ